MSNIKKNYIYNVLYQILIIILPLITAPYISRIIGAEKLGVYSYSYSIAQYFVLFTMLGVNNYGNRSIAQTRNDKQKMKNTFWEIYSLQILLGIIMSILYLGYILLFINNYKLIFFIQMIYLLSSLFDINWFFFGIEQFKLTVVRNAIIKLLTVISIFMFVKSSSDLWIYTIIITTGTMISQLILFWYLFKFIDFEKIKLKNILKHLKPNLILFIPVIATSIYTVMDKIMIGQLSNMTQVGLYEYAEKLKNIPLGLITALGTVMLPKISNMVANKKDKKAILYTQNSMKFALFIAFALSFGLASISKEFVPIFYGDDFRGCVKLIYILVFTIIFISWANVIRTQILIPYNRDKPYIISTIIGAIVNVVLNFLLIKKYGAQGAVIATIVAEIFVAVYQTYAVKDKFQTKPMIRYALIYLIAGSIMLLINRLIGDVINFKILSIILEVSIGGIIYIVICGILLWYIKDPIISQLFSKIEFVTKRRNVK